MVPHVAVEVSRTEGQPWSTVVVRRGQHLLFSASHRDVLTAFRAEFDGVESVCVFHGDSLQDLKGRFFLGFKPTVCTSYNVATTQSTTVVLHPIIPHHVVPGVNGVYVFGHRTTPLKTPLSVSVLSSRGERCAAAIDAWWMSSPLSLRPLVLPSEHQGSNDIAPSRALGVHLFGEWMSHGRSYALSLTHDGILRLATTEHVVSSSVMKWEWLPHAATPFALSTEGLVSVTVGECSDVLQRQSLFIFSEASQKIAIYRTPPLDLNESLSSTSDQQQEILELIGIVPSSCAAISLVMYPDGFVQPVGVVRGWSIDLYCPFTISRLGEASPIASLELPALELHEGLVDVLSVAGSTLRAIATPSMEVRVVDLPNLALTSHPMIHHVFATLRMLSPVVTPNRSYELLHWLIGKLWQSVGDSLSQSHEERIVWDTWNALSELLRKIMIHSLATEDGYHNFCSEVKREASSQHSRFESAICSSSTSSLMYIDPVFITAQEIETEPSRKFDSFVWAKDAGTPATARLQSTPTRWERSECAVAAIGLHTLFESMKLQHNMWNCLSPLGILLADLCSVLGLQQYVRYHVTILCRSENQSAYLRAFDDVQRLDAHVSRECLRAVFGRCSERLLEGLPFDINSVLTDLIYGTPAHAATALETWLFINAPTAHPIGIANALLDLYAGTFYELRQSNERAFRHTWWAHLVQALAEMVHLRAAVADDCLAFGAGQLIKDALRVAKERVDDTWSDNVLELIGRSDKVRTGFASSARKGDTEVIRLAKERAVGQLYNASLVDDDGVQMDADYSKRWPDARLDVAQNILSTAAPVPLAGRGDGSEAAHASLKASTKRVLALPLGRGMLTLSTKNFRVRDVIPTPPLILEGRTSDGILITNELAQASPDCLLWPIFHNGCAAGLRFLPLANASMATPVLSRHWVVYQTRGSHNMPAKGGLLFAAGLLGHLSTLQLTDIYSLLATSQSSQGGSTNRARDPLTLAVILGLSCSFRGTHHEVVFRCLSVHLQSLTPTNADLDVSIEVQTGALFAIGLLCQGSEDAFLVDMLLNEMARLPSDEHCKNRRGYALAAGTSLGLILLGKGRQGIAGVDDRLLGLMTGARRDAHRARTDAVAEFDALVPDEGHFLTRAILHQVSCPASPPCNRILESENYNVNVSGSGAIVALGLMYLKTNDNLMAKKLATVDTLVGQECVLPDHCQLRTCLSCLIAWDSILPSRDWLYSVVPSCLMDLVHHRSSTRLAAAQVRYLMMNMGHAIAGATLALGLRFAGSMSADARNVILGELRGFVAGKIGSSGASMSQVQKSTGAFDSCVASCAVALGLVMAGTGDSISFQVLRKMLKKSAATYGSHMAVSMAIGLIFLGGGKLTLSNSASAVAALLISFYPTWPRDFVDNSDHLQILRHLYVLAVEGRMFQTIDAQTNQPVPLQIRVVLSKQRVQHEDASMNAYSRLWTPMPKEQTQLTVNLTTPCLLPELHTIASIEIRSALHYTLHLAGSDLYKTNPGDLISIRVLAKRNNTTTIGGNVANQCVKDATRHMLNNTFAPSTSVTVVDNLKLLFQALQHHSTLLIDSHAANIEGSDALSADVVESIKGIVAGHFAPLLVSSSLRVEGKHPLEMVLIERLSPSDVADAFASSGQELCAMAPDIEDTSESPKETKPSYLRPNSTLWLTHALQFYGIALPSSTVAPSLLALMHTLRKIENPEARRIQMLLFTAQHRCSIPLHDLTKIVAICL